MPAHLYRSHEAGCMRRGVCRELRVRYATTYEVCWRLSHQTERTGTTFVSPDLQARIRKVVLLAPPVCLKLTLSAVR